MFLFFCSRRYLVNFKISTVLKVLMCLILLTALFVYLCISLCLDHLKSPIGTNEVCFCTTSLEVNRL